MVNFALGFISGAFVLLIVLSVVAYKRLEKRGELNPRVKGAKVKETVVSKLGGN